MDIRSIGSSTLFDSAPAERTAPVGDASASARSAAVQTQTANAVQQPSAVPDMAQVAQAVKSMNKAMESLSQSLEFSVDSDIHRTIVKVVDQQTKQVIRQIPTEEVVELAKALDQVQGLLIRQKV